jgi:ABC-type transport system involved in multi-copper enzyme maturation permease subunit
VSPATEVRLLVIRELGRSVRSLKGLILGIITLVGAVIASIALVWVEGESRARAGSEDALREMRRAILEKQTGDAGLASYLAGMPESLRSFLDITIWLGPLLIALLGFDIIAGELQHKSVRFWTVRTRRGSYFAGKLLGLWALVGLITLALSLLVDIVALAKGYVGFGDLIRWGSRFYFTALIIAGAWAAIATFISSCFRQPIVALLTTFGTFFVLWIVHIAGVAVRAKELIETGTAPDMRWYEYLYPNAYEDLLLSPEPKKVFTAVAILLAFVVAAIAGGSLLFSKRDI